MMYMSVDEFDIHIHHSLFLYDPATSQIYTLSLHDALPILTKRGVRIPCAESLRVPEEGSSAQGKSGPKPRPKGVGDGEQVEIPVPPPLRLSDGVTQEGRGSRGWKCASKRLGGCVGKSRSEEYTSELQSRPHL